jgi:hypothetical protein
MLVYMKKTVVILAGLLALSPPASAEIPEKESLTPVFLQACIGWAARSPSFKRAMSMIDGNRQNVCECITDRLLTEMIDDDLTYMRQNRARFNFHTSEIFVTAAKTCTEAEEQARNLARLQRN